MKVFKSLFQQSSLLIIIAAMLWAFDGVLRRNLYSVSPLVIVFLEHLIGTLILSVVVLSQKKYREKLFIFSVKEMAILSGIALFSGLLGTLWFTTALLKVQFIPFSVVFLLQKLQPIFVFTMAWIVLREHITKTYLKWAGLAFIAAFFITFPKGVVNIATGSGTFIAALYALGAAVAWGSSTILSKMALQNKPSMVVTFWRFALTSVFGSIGVVLFGLTNKVMQVSPAQLSTLLIIALSTGMVAVMLYYRGLTKVQAKIATFLELAFPLTALAIDVILYKSVLHWSQYVAAAVLLWTMFKLSAVRLQRISFESTQVKGFGRGKKIGVPTINLEIPHQLKMESGIYAAYVTVRGRQYHGALHYGPVPTFDQKKYSLEIFLLDTTKVPAIKPSEQIAVEVVQRIRSIQHFESAQLMVKQIELDVQQIRSIL